MIPAMPLPAGTISANVAAIRERIARAAERALRKPESVTLVAVAKTFPAAAIREAYAAGVRHFGENRVQEWESKRGELRDLDAAWHLVGHLQSNKARRAAAIFDCIDSLDSLALARRLNAAVAEIDASAEHPRSGGSTEQSMRLTVLIEVRLAPEATKTGVEPENALKLAEAVLEMPHLELRGLMALPPYVEDAEKVRPYFRRLRELRDLLAGRLKYPLPELSMGMSHDFEVAIEEGATQVRLGTALFGPRGP
jgi:pyridoxal phosphate enzyme (YggS family)